MDPQALKDSWHLVSRSGDQVPLYFYSALFLMYPETRNMFPVSMARQRDRLVGALGHIVSNVDKIDKLVPFLQQLGRDHRKFAVVAEHYPAVGRALLATLEHFLGDRWTPELAQNWAQAYDLVAKVMVEAAEEAAKTTPPWWEAEVISHEIRTLEIAVIRARLNYHYPFQPGQSASVAPASRGPGRWRYYSMANAPRQDNTIDFHVRMIDGGTVSTALVLGTRHGDILRVGAPVGDRLTLRPEMTGDLLLIAGGTGLAPLKALVEQVAYGGPGRKVDLIVGARTARELYDLDMLLKMEAEQPWLTVTPAVSHDPFYRGNRGYAVDVALQFWRGQEVFVCGSEEMVRATVARLLDAGVPADQIHFDEFTSDRGLES